MLSFPFPFLFMSPSPRKETLTAAQLKNIIVIVFRYFLDEKCASPSNRWQQKKCRKHFLLLKFVNSSLLLNELYNKLLIMGRLPFPHLKYPPEASRGVTEEVDKITAHENNENLNS